MKDLLATLTPAQREAVRHTEGPLLILAGPGSGKTRVVTYRIAHLLSQGVPAAQILALTFTNKAAEEMRERVERLVPGHGVWMGTFHRFGAQLLRRHADLVGLEPNYTIYDKGAARALLERAWELAPVAVPKTGAEAVAAEISWAKGHLVGPDEYRLRGGHEAEVAAARLYPLYQSLLLRSNAVDFDDLLFHVARLLRECPQLRSALDRRYRYVLVDEYQDTNLAQYAIARSLSIDHPNLAVTGDPDQSIYGWRGANLRNILEFERDYPEVAVVRLEQNYRSTEQILQVAASLIRHNQRRKEKALFTNNGTGEPVRLIRYCSHGDEAQAIARQIATAIRGGRRRAGDFAVFYRVNALSREFELALHREGIPYQVVRGVEFFERVEVRDIIAYLRLINNPRDEVAFERVVNIPARGIGAVTLKRLKRAAAERTCGLLKTARAAADVAGIGRRPAAALAEFAAMIDRLAAAANRPLEEIAGLVLAETGYQECLRSSGREEDLHRLANIEELLTVAREFDERHTADGHLEAFLEESSLVSDVDDWDGGRDRVTLMTLHASKGLEFPVVFIVALEQGILPHERAHRNADAIEEERRLLFVGITRAREDLHLSLTEMRDFRGQRRLSVASPFLVELPRETMVVKGLDSYQNGDAGWVSTAEAFADDETHYLQAAPADANEASAPPVRPGKETGPRTPGFRLTTAAELAGTAQPSPMAADEFVQGMVVRHPQYGLGRIVALGGQGKDRTATVDFTSTAGRKRFLLEKSPLRPVR